MCSDAIQIFGGYTRELGIERQLRDTIPAAIFSGTSEIQRNLVASELGLLPRSSAPAGPRATARGTIHAWSSQGRRMRICTPM
jgi:hypothetical protein